MNTKDRKQQLAAVTPEVPENFHNAMQDTLNAIVAQESAAQAAPRCGGAPRGIRRRGRALALVLLAALLLATAALAARHWKLFDALGIFTGPAPTTADEVMQSNLAQVTVNGVKITIDEAGYDGRTLFLQYTYLIPGVDTPLGGYQGDSTDGQEGVSDEDMQLLYVRNVGWWIDHLWINGQCVDMPGNSGSVTNGSPTPGELVQTEYWQLDNVGVQLSGKVEIALPIGERQPLEDYSKSKHPEKYDENGMLKMPSKGLVTFMLDASGMLNKVRTSHPGVPVTLPGGTAEVSEASFTPLMTYITLKLSADPAAVAAYQAENGKGVYDENGTLIVEYGGADVFSNWINSLNLVDGDGNLLFPDSYGQNGLSDEWAEFVYPYLANLPGTLYLAPIEDGKANMTYAVQVR